MKTLIPHYLKDTESKKWPVQFASFSRSEGRESAGSHCDIVSGYCVSLITETNTNKISVLSCLWSKGHGQARACALEKKLKPIHIWISSVLLLKCKKWFTLRIRLNASMILNEILAPLKLTDLQHVMISSRFLTINKTLLESKAQVLLFCVM